MKANVSVDSRLMEDALKLSGLRTREKAIEAALKLLIQVKRQAKVREFRGRLKWVGDLDEMRRDR